jgi:hypothetical protein
LVTKAPPRGQSPGRGFFIFETFPPLLRAKRCAAGVGREAVKLRANDEPHKSTQIEIGWHPTSAVLRGVTLSGEPRRASRVIPRQAADFRAYGRGFHLVEPDRLKLRVVGDGGLATRPEQFLDPDRERNDTRRNHLDHSRHLRQRLAYEQPPQSVHAANALLAQSVRLQRQRREDRLFSASESAALGTLGRPQSRGTRPQAGWYAHHQLPDVNSFSTARHATQWTAHGGLRQ